MESRFIRSVAFSTVLALTPWAAGCDSAPPDSHEIVIGTVDELCASTANVAPFTAADGEVLPPLGNEYRPKPGKETFVGRLVVDGGRVTLQLSPLPTETEASLIAAVDPFVACAAAQGDWDTEIFVTNGSDSGEFSNIDTGEFLPQKGGEVRLAISASEDPAERLISERGAPRIALTHESLHGYVNKWLDDLDGKERKYHLGYLNDLHLMFNEDLRGAAEDFRIEQGDAVGQKLGAIKQAAEKAGHGDLARSLQEVMRRLDIEGGLHELALDCSRKEKGYCVANDITDIIRAAGQKVDAEVDDDHLKKFRKEIREVQDAYSAYLQKQFAAVDESSTLASVIHNPRVGHPYDNFNEWLVSLMNSMRHNRKAVVNGILAMPASRQARYGDTIKMLEYMAENEDPELYAAIPFKETREGLVY